jgi:hypothetical protein
MDGTNFTNSDNTEKIIINMTSLPEQLNNSEKTKKNISNSANGTDWNEKNELAHKQKYMCLCCDFSTSKKYDYDRHNNSIKHYNRINNISKNNDIICENCGKKYSNKTNLNKHMKKCKDNGEHSTNIDNDKNIQPSKTAISSDLVLEILKQSKDIQSFLVEQTKELHNTLIQQNNKILELSKNQYVVNNTMNNTQQFNLNFFLNETCKDAVNITDFVNSLELNVEDFEATGKLGYVEGISRIIINGMRDMEVEKRPMHCTDFKRETLYIKDENVWTKENIDKNKFKKVVKKVAQLNLNQLPRWQAKYPDCVKLDTWENEEFIKLSLAALGSRNDEEEEKFMDKIMKNVLREVVISRK